MAFTMIGDGRHGIGVRNYLRNLLAALSVHAADEVSCVLFAGADIEDIHLAPFQEISGLEIVRSEDFNNRGAARVRSALFFGSDAVAAKTYRAHRIDVAFESAVFFGWRFPIPVLAWIPDFQHRRIPWAFPFAVRMRREIGFQVQALSGRPIMLSSEDARKDCERFYPTTRGRTVVVPFATPPAAARDAVADRKVADSYGLPRRFFYLPNQFWSHKNHACVIEALAIAKAKGRLNLTVAASGGSHDPRDPGLFDRLMARVEELGLSENFRVLGFIPYAHVGALVNTCEAVINPSRFEGWSTPVEEAKAAGARMLLSSLPVHHDQAAGRAEFFNPDDPAALAILMMASIERTSEQRARDAEAAKTQAQADHVAFAQRFAKIATQIAHRERPVTA